MVQNKTDKSKNISGPNYKWNKGRLKPYESYLDSLKSTIMQVINSSNSSFEERSVSKFDTIIVWEKDVYFY